MRCNKRLLVWIMAAAVVTVAAISSVIALCTDPQLMVFNQQDGRVYYAVESRDGIEITLSWIHSIEHQPWTETYVVDGTQLILEQITIESYGAGVPADPGGVTTIEDGVIHVREIHKPFNEIRWVHSHDTNYTVTIDDHLIHTGDIEHHAFVELSIKE